MRPFFIFLALLVLTSCGMKTVHNWEEIKSDKIMAFWVSEIIQGDRVCLSDGTLVQYLGIRSPQRGEEYFEECCKANADLLGCNGKNHSLQQKVLLKFASAHPNKLGYYQAYVYYPVTFIPDKGMVLRFVNKELLEFGYAVADVHSDDHPYSQEFLKAQEIAKKSKAGLWQKK